MHYHLKLVESGEGNFDFTREFFLPHPGREPVQSYRRVSQHSLTDS